MPKTYEQLLEYAQQYQQKIRNEDPDAFRKQRREYYAENKDRIRIQRKEYRERLKQQAIDGDLLTHKPVLPTHPSPIT